MSWLFPVVHTLKEPLNDRLADKAQAPYFRDALSVKVENSTLTPSQLQHRVFSYMPTWVAVLMRIRNKIVKYLGFSVGTDNLRTTSDELMVGDKAGFLTIIEKYENEVISYAEDKHMSMYISVIKQSNQLIISTLVNQKTIIGRLYVNCIIPFHYIIARSVISNAIKHKRI